MNDLQQELINGKGFSILPIDNMSHFEKLKDKFIEKMSKFSTNKDMKSLRHDMADMNKEQINELMISLLSFEDASEIMIKSCSKIVKSLCGEKIFLQRRATTIFNMPGEDQRRQWPHYELMSGVSPYTFIIWAPFHDLDDDGGVFYLDLEKSHSMIEEESKLGIVNGPLILNKNYNEKPVKLKYGEVIVFCPFVLHGNVNFKSNLARIACSVRFQSTNKPLFQKDTDYFKYFKF